MMKKHPVHGYFPAPEKSYLVLEEKYITHAKDMFENVGIKVVTNQRMLGSVIGDEDGKLAHVKRKVQKWVEDIDSVTRIAASQPQAACTAFTKSMQCEWNYLQWIVPNCGGLFEELDNALASKFLPAVFQNEVTQVEHELFILLA